MILIPISCNFFSGSPSANNFEVKRAWPGAMGDRPGSSSRVRTSEDKVRRKDLYWSVRAVYVLVKLPDVSGPSLGEVGRYRRSARGETAYRAIQASKRGRGGAVGPR